MDKIEEYSGWILTSIVIIYTVFLIDLYHYSAYLHGSAFLNSKDFSLFFASNPSGCHVISFNGFGVFLLIFGPIFGSYSIAIYYRNSGILHNQFVEYYNVDQKNDNPTLNFEYPDSSNLHAKFPDRNNRIIFYGLLIFHILVPAVTILFIFASGNNVLVLQMPLSQILIIILYSWGPSILVYTTRIIRLETKPEYFQIIDIIYWIAIISNALSIIAINSNLYCN